MENAINDDGYIEGNGEHDTKGLKKSENDIQSLQFYNDVEGCITMEKFHNCFS